MLDLKNSLNNGCPRNNNDNIKCNIELNNTALNNKAKNNNYNDYEINNVSYE